MTNTRSLDVLTEHVEYVPIGTKYTSPYMLRLLWAHIHYQADATAGNRSVRFDLCLADGTVLYDIRSGVNQGASTVRHYNFVRGTVRETTFSGGNELIMPLPDLIVMPGTYLTCVDENNVSSGDTFELAFQAIK